MIMPNSWNVLEIMGALPALRPGSEGRSFRECRSLRLLLHAVKIDGCPSIFRKKKLFSWDICIRCPQDTWEKKVKNNARKFCFFIKLFFLGTNEKNVRHFEKQNTRWYAPMGS
jgi:hypothetical protein